MEMQQIIEQAQKNIWQAIDDYRRHTTQTDVLDDVEDVFVRELARDSSYAKQNLRELFSKSPVWDERIDALVINGTRTHNPDYDRIRSLAHEILWVPLHGEHGTMVEYAIELFSDPNQSEADKTMSIHCINQLAPKAYAPTKKLSRVFKSLCQALGVADETAGCEFQRLYAQFADELTSKKLGFKLYVSINPAHFLTMSNPKADKRGNTLTSCHSFNSTEYGYNNGCIGYARDEVSFIVFTVADPAQPETLNNRKTTRQIFAYRPGSGLLMQSRMYNTTGGVYGAAEDSKLYRDLVQREISMLENVPNLWNTFSSVKEGICDYVEEGDGFGGYADWTYENFDGHISFRKDCDRDEVEPLEVGTYGLCIRCGCEHSDGLYCDDCKLGDCRCDECGDYYDEDDMYAVYNERGEQVYVCENCKDSYYIYCDRCGEYHHQDCMTEIDGQWYCDGCRDEYCEQCEDCDEWHVREDMYCVRDKRGNEIWVCGECIDGYALCDCCEEYHPVDAISHAYKANGSEVYVCGDCIDEFEICPHCGELVQACEDGTCPNCGAVINETEEEAI